SPDVQLNIKYGILQNNWSDGLTPSHNNTMNVTGGTGPAFSYSGNLSYQYTGQWQPALFSRAYGASIGVTHVNGPFTVSGSVGLRNNSNGFLRGGSFVYCGNV